MFGVVPRVLWERVCPPDDLNRITLTCNCLFIDTGKEKILIETGMGEKWSPKEMSIYGISRAKPFAKSLFDITGCKPEDITIVINTHLHFDHAGGDTEYEGEKIVPAFPRARYVIQKDEWEDANHPHERNAASYLAENFAVLGERKVLELASGEQELEPGLSVVQTGGHCRGRYSHGRRRRFDSCRTIPRPRCGIRMGSPPRT